MVVRGRVGPSGAWNQYAEREMEWWSIGVMGKPTCLSAARICGEKITDFLASQARQEMRAPVELFAGGKRGREKFAKVRIVTARFAKGLTDQARKSAIVRTVTGGINFLRKLRGAKSGNSTSY